MKKFQHLLLLMLFALPLTTVAQPFVEFTAQSTDVTCETNTVEIDIDVKDFIQMGAWQFTFSWDNTVLSFVSLDDTGLIPGIAPSTGSGPSGFVTFSWFSASPPMVSDGTALTFTFDVIGDASQSTLFTYSNQAFVQYGQPLTNEFTLSEGQLNITDSEAPTFTTCPGDVTVDTNGAATAQINTGTPVTLDNCGVDFLSYSLSAPTSGSGTGDVSNNVDFEIGTTTVTYIANDFEGNASQPCSFDVQVDNTAPPSTILSVSLENEMINCETNTVSIDVTADLFQNMRGAQFTINWDETFLQYIDTANVVFNPTNIAFGITDIANGELSFSWGNSTPLSLNNGTVLFTINFQVMNLPAGFTLPITFNSIFTEFTNESSFPLFMDPSEYETMNGSVVLFDNEPPTLSCPDDITVTTMDGGSVIVNDIEPTVTDNCGIRDTAYTLTDAMTSTSIGSGTGDASGFSFPVGTTTVEYIVTDFDDNEVRCDFTVTISTPDPIVFDIENIQTNCTDNLDTVGILVENFDDIRGAEFTISWDPTELEYVEIIQGNLSPSVAPGESDVATGQLSLSWFGSATSLMDGDDFIQIAFNIVDNTAPGPFVVDFTNDLQEVTTQSSFPLPISMGEFELIAGAISIVDVTPPTITCPMDTLINISSGTEVEVNDIAAMASDLCGSVAISYEIFTTPSITGTVDASGNNFPIGTTMVTYTAMDEAGLTTSCSFNVTITQDPLSIDCPSDVNQSADAGSCDAMVGSLPVTILSSLANISSISYSMSSGTSGTGNVPALTYDVGTTVVTYTVTDNFGAMEMCSFNVVITDDENPTITCPSDVAVSANNNCMGQATWTTPTAADNCDNDVQITSSHNSGDLFPLGTTVVTYYIEDDAGNQDSCKFNVIIEDNTLPTITCPSDVAVSANSNCMGQATWTTPIAMDNCDNDVQITSSHNSGDLFPLGTTVVTYYIEDDAGNQDSCKFNVTTIDNSLPTITCPADVTFTVIGNCLGEATWADPTVSDNCDTNVDVSSTHTSGDLFDLGTTEVTYYIEDDAGNQDSCKFNVTILSGTVPTLTCPADVSVSASNTCIGQATWNEPTAANSCGTPVTITSTHDSGDFFNLGTTIVTYYIEDDMGNQDSCKFNVIVTDNTAPTINCPSDMTVDASNNCMGQATWNIPTPTDNCDLTPQITSTHNSGAFFPLGTTIVTYYVEDEGGNIDSCKFNITVEDNQIPTIVCPSDVTVSANNDCMGEAIWTVTSVNDNCDTDVQITGTHASGDLFDLGTTEVTLYIEDDAGNQDSCKFNVIVIDTTVPTIVCPDDVVVSASTNCMATATWDDPVTNDNCDSDVQTVSTFLSGDLFDFGTTVVTYYLVDDAGNIDSCKFNVIVEDDVAPEITCPDDIVISAGNGCSAQVFWDAPTVTDNCDNNILTSANIPSGSTFTAGTTTVTIFATDASGNTGSCSFTVTVTDSEPPSIFCPANVTVSTNGSATDPNGFLTGITPVGCDSIILTFDAPIGSDNCLGWTVAQTAGDVSGSTFGMGVHNMQFTITDASNNTSLCELSVTVEPFANIIVSAMPAEICTGESSQLLIADIPGSTCSWTGPDGFTSNICNPIIDNATKADSGTYVVTVTDPSTNCTGTVEVELVVLSSPEIDIDFSQSICGDGMTDIPISGMNVGTIDIASWVWINPDGDTISMDQNAILTNATPDDSGTYTLEATGVNGCVVSVQQLLSVAGNPATPAISSTCSGFACVGEVCTLQGIFPPGTVDSILWTVNLPAGGLPEVVNVEQVQIIPEQDGIYTYTFTVFSNGCTASAISSLQVGSPANVEPDFFEVPFEESLNNFDVTDNDTYSGTLPGTFTINVTSNVQNGELTNNGDGTFSYVPEDGYFGIDQFIYEICIDCDGETICRWAIVTLDVTTDDCLIPTVITPNDDEMNDALEITCVSDNPNNELIIYNRWGDEVFRAAPYNNDWKGTYNNAELPDGTYFYVFKTGPDDNDPKKGALTIMR